MTQNKFAFFANFSEAIKALPEEKQAGAYQAICEYGIYGTLPTDPMYLGLCLMAKASIYKEDGRSNNGGNHNPKGINQHSEVGQLGQSRSNEVNSGQLGQSRTIPLETETETETRNGSKKETSKEKVSKFGELGFVRLTDEQYTTLKQKYSDLDAAIEVLDTWLGTTGSKHRNKNHYAYFKQNSWVWERLAENHPKESQKIEYSLPKETTKEEIHKMVEARKREDEEAKQRAAEAQRRSDFIKSKGYASTVALISAGKEVYDRVMSEYRQAQGF